MNPELDDSTATSTIEGREPRDHGQSRPMLLMMTGQTIGRMYALEGEPLVIGRSVDAQVWTDDNGVSRHHAEVLFTDGKPCVHDLKSKNGTFRNGERVEDRVLLADGDQIRVGRGTILKFTYVDVVTDALQRTLYDAATRDGLTGVYNKRFLKDALAKEFATSVRQGTPLGFLMMDLDHFKAINDTFGHTAGDKVLVRIASLLQSPIRAEDVLARFGGEEFALVLRDCKREDVLKLADRLRQLVEAERMTIAGREVRVTLSVGVATMPASGSLDAESLIASADAQLYVAKQSGRNRVSSS